MKLSDMRRPPRAKKVWQADEHQGVAHPRRWYQSYARNAKPYRQSKQTGPTPEGYSDHIMPVGK